MVFRSPSVRRSPGSSPTPCTCRTAPDLATYTVIWGGGESAAADARHHGHHPGRGGRIDVAADLSVPGYPGVFAVGDAANIPGPDGRALPQLGSVAQQSGKWAARNITPRSTVNRRTPFHYHDKGIMAMIGRNAAVAEVGVHRHQVEGPLAFAAWLGLHAILLNGVHSHVDAFLNWADDYFHHDRAPDLELDGTPSPGSSGRRRGRGSSDHRAWRVA